MIVVCRNAKSASTGHFPSGYGKIKSQSLILHNTNCNGYEQISKEICSKIKDFVSKQVCFD